MDAHHFNEVFKPLLIVYGILTPVVVITIVFLKRKKEIVYTMTDHRGYKLAVTLDFQMSQDQRRAALREIGLRPPEYKTQDLPPGVLKVVILNGEKYGNAL